MGWHQSHGGAEKIGRKRLLERKDKSTAALPDHVRPEEEREVSLGRGRKQVTQGSQVNLSQVS